MRTPFAAGVTGVAMTAAALLVVTAPTASGDHQSSSSAYGVAVGGTPGQPTVTSDGSETRAAGGQLPAELGPLASGGVLTLTAGDDHASAKITDLTLGHAAAQLPQQLKDGLANLTQACTVVGQAGPADQAIAPLNTALDQLPGVGQVVQLPTVEAATTFCEGLLDADILSLARVGSLLTECRGTTGTVTLSDVAVLGAPQPLLAGAVPPDTQLLPPELAAVARITLNHQRTDGEDFTVDGLRIEVGGNEVAVLASATCGGPTPHVPEVQEEPTSQVEPPKAAPVPDPVQASVPVTG
jgi:hypothetical protein